MRRWRIKSSDGGRNLSGSAACCDGGERTWTTVTVRRDGGGVRGRRVAAGSDGMP